MADDGVTVWPYVLQPMNILVHRIQSERCYIFNVSVKRREEIVQLKHIGRK